MKHAPLYRLRLKQRKIHLGLNNISKSFYWILDIKNAPFHREKKIIEGEKMMSIKTKIGLLGARYASFQKHTEKVGGSSEMKKKLKANNCEKNKLQIVPSHSEFLNILLQPFQLIIFPAFLSFCINERNLGSLKYFELEFMFWQARFCIAHAFCLGFCLS